MSARHQQITRYPRSLSDDMLVAGFRSGDNDAFAEIFRRYHGALRSFAGRMLSGSGHDPDDVVQDAFIRAHRGLRVTDGPMALRPWLYMIVRNRALDDLRAPKRTDVLDDQIGPSLVPAPDPAQAIAERAAMRELVGEIARLPERQRIALVLREFDGRSHVETAAALQTTVPATKSLIIRARRTLQATLVAA